jgi:hypothetical protein
MDIEWQMLWRFRHLEDDGIISFEDERVLIADAAIWRKKGHFEAGEEAILGTMISF